MAHQVASPPDPREALMRLASDASHEIVGPANQVASLVALFVNRYKDQLDSEAEQLLSHIQSSGTRLANGATALRAYFRILSGRHELSRVSSTTVLHLVVESLQPEILDCGAQIRAEELPDIEGNMDLLGTVFEALLRNSLKFRRPEIPPLIAISAEPAATQCRFTVADNGIGIDPAYADKVFELFSRLNGHAYPGVGMGLSLARAALEIMRGRIWVGKKDVGASLMFELPAARA